MSDAARETLTRALAEARTRLEALQIDVATFERELAERRRLRVKLEEDIHDFRISIDLLTNGDTP